jgi:hypothetical protein
MRSLAGADRRASTHGQDSMRANAHSSDVQRAEMKRVGHRRTAHHEVEPASVSKIRARPRIPSGEISKHLPCLRVPLLVRLVRFSVLTYQIDLPRVSSRGVLARFRAEQVDADLTRNWGLFLCGTPGCGGSRWVSITPVRSSAADVS